MPIMPPGNTIVAVFALLSSRSIVRPSVRPLMAMVTATATATTAQLPSFAGSTTSQPRWPALGSKRTVPLASSGMKASTRLAISNGDSIGGIVSFEVSASLTTTDYDDGDALAANIADVLVSDAFSDALRAADDATFEEAVMDPSSVGTVVAEPARRPSALPTTLKPTVARAQDEDEDEDEESSRSSDDGSDDGEVGSVAKKKKKPIRRIGAASSSVFIAASVVLVLIFALCVGGVRCCARQRYKGATLHSDATLSTEQTPATPEELPQEWLERASPLSPMQKGQRRSSWGLEMKRSSIFESTNPLQAAGGAMSRVFTAPAPTNRDDRWELLEELQENTGAVA